MKLSAFNKTERGYSHIKENKICQDYSLSYSASDKSLFAAIVSDGHGSKTYCRSDRGSKFACEIAMEAIKGMTNLNELLKGKSAQVPVRKPMKQNSEDDVTVKFEDVYPAIKDIDLVFEHFFQYIYSQWVQSVENDWNENPPTEEEKQLLGDNDIVKAYGATLIAFVRTPACWFGFQIGDGKCLACDEQGKWYEPILWDSECFLNVTTSLCQSEAYKSFRYSFSGKGDFPIAVTLGSDGIDDSWGDKLPAYYTSILKDILTMGLEKAQRNLTESLPELTKRGSGDDVSVAWIVDENTISVVLPKLQLIDLQQENQSLLDTKKKLEETIKHLKEEQNDKNLKIEKYKDESEKLKKELEKKSFTDKKNETTALHEQIDLLTQSLSEAESKIEKLQKTDNEPEKKIVILYNHRNVKKGLRIYKKQIKLKKRKK